MSLTKDINKSAFNENMTTRKRSDVRIFFRDLLPNQIFGIATYINGVVKIYDTNQDAEALNYAYISHGELHIVAPPNTGDKTIIFTHEHSLPHPNNGKRYSSSFFYDTWQTGEHYVGFCNFDESNQLKFVDAILMKYALNEFSGEVYSNGTKKTWLDIAGNPKSNVVSQDVLTDMLFKPEKGHLFDLQTQLRNVGDLFFHMSDKQRKEPREVLEYTGLNNQDNATVSNCAMHGVFVAVNNGTQSHFRAGCLDISNETDDKDLYYPAVFENESSVTCPALNPTTNPNGTVMKLVYVPFKISDKLNTRDCKYYQAKIYTDKRSKVKIFKLPNTSYVTKGNGVTTKQPLVDTLSTAGGDWTQDPQTNLWYIDNSIDLPNNPGYRIDGIDLTLAEKVDGGSSSGAAVIPMEYPNTDEIPLKITHGQLFAVVGIGITASASMSIDTLYAGESI